jgi:hypothetical protein
MKCLLSVIVLDLSKGINKGRHKGRREVKERIIKKEKGGCI